MITDYDSKRLSKTISVWLRHHPERAGLSHDEFGWVSIDSLLAALAQRNVFITPQELAVFNHSTGKVRWSVEIENNRIRATHGHSIPVVIGKAEKPPDVLFHGTGIGSVESIKKQGILPMSRKFVHLSADIDAAHSVGRRHSNGKSFVFIVDAEKLYEAGGEFFHTSDNVWLTKMVPAEFLFNEVSR